MKNYTWCLAVHSLATKETLCDLFELFHNHRCHRLVDLELASCSLEKKIIEKNMMIFSLQVACELLQYPLSKLLLCTAHFPSIHLQFLEEAIVAIC